MPRSQGTSRKGKPGKHDRAAGMGKALQRQQQNGRRRRPTGGGGGGGGMALPVTNNTPAMDTELQETVTNNNHNTQSVLEMNDLDDFLHQAHLANEAFTTERHEMVVLDAVATVPRTSAVTWQDQQAASSFQFQELSVPRRPPWNTSMSKDELHRQEEASFLEWRRSIAKLQETCVQSTPFEKNLQVWRQLWRVLEQSDVLIQIVDARHPLFYMNADLYQYAKHELNKPCAILINKSDYWSSKQRQQWKDFLMASVSGGDEKKKCFDHVFFFSATLEQEKLDKAAQEERQQQQEEQLERFPEEKDDNEDDQQESDKPDDKETAEDDPVPLLTREQLIQNMIQFAKTSGVTPGRNNKNHHPQSNNDNDDDNDVDENKDELIQFGMVGFPNVGKSSVINVLMGSSKHQHGVSRVGVARQPGKTKHFQTLLLPDYSSTVKLCDCPGLVFPSLVSQTSDLIAAGVYPIAQMRDFWPVMELIAQRIPRELLNATYGIQLPTPLKLRDSNNTTAMREADSTPPPTPQELLDTYCHARSLYAASSGVPDHQRAARRLVQDYASGKLLYCHAPPSLITESDYVAFQQETTKTALQMTEKVRERLEKQQQQHEQQANTQSDSAEANATSEEGDADFPVDDDLLEFMGAMAPSDDGSKTKDMSAATTTTNQHKRNKKGGKTPKQKWGKKDRKNRNKDPYGCHSTTPDGSLFTSAGTGGGVVMNAGRYTQSGYTRPTTYPTTTSR